MKGSYAFYHKLPEKRPEKAKVHLLSLPAYENHNTRRYSKENIVEQHYITARNAYKAKADDREKSKDDLNFKIITFYMQQCLPKPHIHSLLAFYKHQLWVYNLTMHDCDNAQGFSYMWNGSDTVNHVTMLSDMCADHNKNAHVAAMCIVALQNTSHLNTIDHKFLVPRTHTYGGSSVNWRCIRWLWYDKNMPMYVSTKLLLKVHAPFETISFHRWGQANPVLQPTTLRLIPFP
ncbi:hypothetical protein PR048_015437 [Dryococelus australis]|uniref:Uncharacterized protein n=1 Tax=Dryococelus australis TaxID=614101 RepID=A0ABQ9HGY6_9NEOP|nr:hypothetical protein PR048_015437 [Dryococelus australis]